MTVHKNDVNVYTIYLFFPNSTVLLLILIDINIILYLKLILDLLECSCHLLREKTSISSVIGEDLHAFSLFDEEMDVITIYDSEEDNIIQYANSNEPLKYQEMPTQVCESKKVTLNTPHTINYNVYIF